MNQEQAKWDEERTAYLWRKSQDLRKSGQHREAERIGREVVMEYAGIAHYLSVKSSRGCPEMDKDDLLQELLLTLVMAWNQYRPAKGSFSTYAFVACLNRSRLAFAQLRKLAAREKHVSDDSFFDSRRDYRLDAREYEEDLLAKIRTAIGRLDPRTRSVIESRSAGEGVAEIAARMVVSKQRVSQIEKRGIKMLARMCGCMEQPLSIHRVG